MATAEELASLRLMIAEPDDSTYTDDMLSTLLDVASLPAEVAAQVWTQKAAAYAALVDISEGGSSRKNSDLHKNALTMAALYRSEVDLVTVNRPTRVARLSRG